jgi:hypothetical protein
MNPPPAKHRYEMVNVRPGYLVIEQEQATRTKRSYFVAESHPPVEEYREEGKFWKPFETAQSFQFDVRDHETGEVIPFRELLGLLYYGCCREGSDIRRMGEIAHDLRISVYIAIAAEGADGKRLDLPNEKIRVLNRLFNERLRTPDKKLLILPDLFGLYKEISYGQIAIDFGLTSME